MLLVLELFSLEIQIMVAGLSALIFASSLVPTTNQQLGVAFAGAAGLLAIALNFTRSYKD